MPLQRIDADAEVSGRFREPACLRFGFKKRKTELETLPLTDRAVTAFKEQMEEAVGSEYLFPRRTECGNKPYLCGLKKVWLSTLRCARVPYFSLYVLRHTFATRLSAGGVADYFVTLMLRQGRAGVFKRYSQAKLNVMREALDRLDRQANEHERGFVFVQNDC
ncbi:MAG: hypothetical protein ACRD2P_13475 [Terriglobia bacterium]